MAHETNITSHNTELLERIFLGLVLLDTQLHLLDMNSAAEEIFGTSRAHVSNTPLVELAWFETAILKRIVNLHESDAPFTAREVTTGKPGGAQLVVDLTALRTQLAGQDCIVLELQRIDGHLRIAREESLLAQQQANQLLLRNLAHEIKNPLGGLRGAAQLLSQDLSDSHLTDYTKIIINEADRLAALVEQMLGPSTHLQLEALNLHQLIEHVSGLLIADAPKQIEFVSDYDPSIPHIETNRDLLIQALLNIGRNAIEALGTQTPAQIILRTRCLRKHTLNGRVHRLVVQIQIADNGPGVPHKLGERIFHPMVSGHPDGNGLGLSITQNLMAQLGGLIEYSSGAGETVFSLYLPLLKTHERG